MTFKRDSLETGRDRLKQGASHVSAMLHRMSGRRNGDRLGMLLHHRVSPIPSRLPAAPFNVHPDRFRRQLEGLLEHGCEFTPFGKSLEARRLGRPVSQGSVVLTFDDAYESVYRHAFPIMKELGVPGIAFLSTAFLDSEDPFPFDEYSLKYRDRLPPEEYRPLKVSQCREMLASGLFEFGAHTHTHGDFRGRPDEFRHDVSKSVATLRQLFQIDNIPLAYPWGATGDGDELVEAARNAGVSCAVTTESVLVDPVVDDHFMWGRFVVFPWDTPDTLFAKLAGFYGWAHRVKDAIGPLKRRARRLVPTSAFWAGLAPEWSYGAIETVGVCSEGFI
jgi:peptidoglycan/xylan/chitin deacetylase (PgdA/CDA1 family)